MVATAMALDPMRSGSNSEIISQNIGPRLSSKKARNASAQASPIRPFWCWNRVEVEKYPPRAPREATMPAEPMIRSLLRPAQSISNAARSAKTKVTTHLVPAIPLGTASPSFAFWFIALTLVTIFGAFGALAQNMGLFVTLGTLAAGVALTAAGFYAGSVATLQAGGWLFVVSAAAAWLTAGAMVLEHAFGRTIIPLGKWNARANVPGVKATDPIAYPAGMPGVRVGQ